MAKILISGGTGMVGRRLTALLLKAGYEVNNLSRSGSAPQGATGFRWNYPTGEIDEKAFEGVSKVIHLAGAPVADGLWTASRKKILTESRLKTGELLVKTSLKLGISLDQFITASGIAYYGFEPDNHSYTEEDPVGPGYLGELARQWEGVSKPLEDQGIPVTRIRIGVVLGPEGALPKLALPVKWGVGSAMGNGRQVMSWIHLEDLCQLFLFCVQNDQTGIFNAVSPEPRTQKDFIRTIAKVVNRPMWAPAIPGGLLKMAAGDMAREMLLGGITVSSEKIRNLGFEFQYPDLHSALRDLL
ncbi:TIGR01777 family oxidoreductase [bacterium SCSIO 12741]|nr:TIGR01777 family oxidoreductase [bacterium SCSIO 12741]